RIVDIELVRGQRRIEAFAHEIALLLLEGLRDLEPLPEAQEKRARIGGEPLGPISPQPHELEGLPRHEPHHAGAPFRARHGDAIDARLDDARTGRDGLCDLERRNVLALPAESVADAVDEIEETLLVLPHQVSSSIPGIALDEDIAQ